MLARADEVAPSTHGPLLHLARPAFILILDDPNIAHGAVAECL
jgi:hypothetical protein